MTRRYSHRFSGLPAHPRRQRGVVLAVVLILLLVMTLLGLASLRGTLMEERMSASQFDRSLGFHAAEAALREAETLATSKPSLPSSGCSNGICARPDAAVAADRQRWLNADFWGDDSGNWRQATVEVGDLVARPRYIVELMDDAVADPSSCTTGGDVSLEAGCTMQSSRYRITVRSQQDGRAEVMLQSIYSVP